MSLALEKPWTVETFLAWEEHQELRYEFDGLRIIAMTGGTSAHGAIQINVVLAVGNRLRGKPCRLHGSNLKIRVMDSIRYPDAFVSCTPIGQDDTVVHEPVVIFEVASASTAFIDRGAKNREYAGTASVRRYVMLEQRAVMATVYERAGEDWVGHIFRSGDTLPMPEIGIELPLDELYEGLDLSQAGDFWEEED